MSGSNDQALADPAKLAGVADELSIEKHGRAVGIDRHLDFGRDRGHDVTLRLHHGHRDQFLFAGLQRDVAREILVSVLAH